MKFLFWDIKWIEDEDIPNKLITLREADLQKIMYGEFAKKPFVWDIDFAEIFGDKNGFDVVIGNPPYVSEEDSIKINQIVMNIAPSAPTKIFREKGD